MRTSPSNTRFVQRRIQGMLLAAGMCSLLAACSSPVLAPRLDHLGQLTVPEPIRVPKGHQIVLDAQAKGTLVYECQAVQRAPFRYNWLPPAAGVQLRDARGQTMTYYPGPRARWVHSDGSAVAAREFVETPGDATKLPLMRATAEMSTGPGVLDKVSYIQLLRTSGGVVSNPPCTASSLGMRVAIPFEADLVFWRPVS